MRNLGFGVQGSKTESQTQFRSHTTMMSDLLLVAWMWIITTSPLLHLDNILGRQLGVAVARKK